LMNHFSEPQDFWPWIMSPDGTASKIRQLSTEH
jgi:hypothetical protein